VVEGKIGKIVPFIFSADEMLDVGGDSAAPVIDDYGPIDSAFTGRVNWVQFDLDEAAEDLDHLITSLSRSKK
jgi:arylsulfatase